MGRSRAPCASAWWARRLHVWPAWALWLSIRPSSLWRPRVLTGLERGWETWMAWLDHVVARAMAWPPPVSGRALSVIAALAWLDHVVATAIWRSGPGGDHVAAIDLLRLASPTGDLSEVAAMNPSRLSLSSLALFSLDDDDRRRHPSGRIPMPSLPHSAQREGGGGGRVPRREGGGGAHRFAAATSRPARRFRGGLRLQWARGESRVAGGRADRSRGARGPSSRRPSSPA